MGREYAAIDEGLAQFIARQKVFFVGSAPGGPAGLVNVSPKGLDTFCVLGPRQVGYADFTGSGVETIAHVRENGRLTILFCAFEGPPKILRLYGRARVVEAGAAEFAELAAHFPAAARHAGVRAIILLDLTRIADSCGWGVPLMEYRGDREQLPAWAEKKGPSEVRNYQREHNAVSLDGLPGLGANGV